MTQASDHSYTPSFTVRKSPGAGQGAFAVREITAGTVILRADKLTAHVILREYRGEVCWECFAYDRGRKLVLRDQTRGFTFCSQRCESVFLKRGNDGVCLEAWAAVEKSSKLKSRAPEDGAEEGTNNMTQGDKKPTAVDIDDAWHAAAPSAASIVEARARGPQAAKVHKRALQQALSSPPPPDILNFQTHAILTQYTDPVSWESILSLAHEPCPYASWQELDHHIKSYLHLLAILPETLLPLTNDQTLRTIKCREVHNSFGIRSLEDGGSEFFGFGVWPCASYFNHSCLPNVTRRRVGRTWVFQARGDVRDGQELYISYLNGEEDTLATAERRARLRKHWGFECACERCRGAV
ncbi:SET domain-containing protein [Cryphonectria parasitica EP155]|uniref:SET domain-containing protein n=1 Tax=Cryphonectria parasitica (strain ATCC 38755 / EP155) TaxID=660469 RepID=A0A9P4XRX1_CRYP1|nr:SET domain-containing protein [Cryphonectria parasitica EP155]KAF3759916.1 SET domain-containing protein [Cryphonectria parasitica EP155]